MLHKYIHTFYPSYFRNGRNTFTRAQRLACCFTALYLMMIVSAMFYRTTEDSDDTPSIAKIGPFIISMQELFVSAISAAIVFPSTIAITLIFR